MTHPDIAILGPTCSWKSSVAVLAAEALSGEVVSCDSMQVYAGMDIGTATPSLSERHGIPHHLVSCLSVTQLYGVQTFVEEALKISKDIRSRGGLPVLAGGTGLYAKALIQGFRFLPADQRVSAQLQADFGNPQWRDSAIEELQRADPRCELPESVRQNPRRLLRAIEVLRITGKPPWRLDAGSNAPAEEFRQYVFMPEPQILKQRICQRIRRMLAMGWIEEVRCLVAAGLLNTPTAKQALGYRDIAAYLNGAISSMDELAEILIRRTVRYARRQRTWFRNQHPESVRLCIRRATGPEELADIVLTDYAQREPIPGDGTTILVE